MEEPISERKVQLPGDTEEWRLQVLVERDTKDAGAALLTAEGLLDAIIERGVSFHVRHQRHPDGKADDPRPYELLMVVAYLPPDRKE